MDNDFKFNLSVALVAVILFSCCLICGSVIGQQITKKQNKIYREKLEDVILDVATKSYQDGFVDGLILGKNFIVVGEANWCNLDMAGKSLECNYNTEIECKSYMQPDQLCVRNHFKR